MNNDFGMDDLDRELMATIRKAVEGYKQGDPAKDFIDEDQMMEGLDLLVSIVDTGTAK